MMSDLKRPITQQKRQPWEPPELKAVGSIPEVLRMHCRGIHQAAPRGGSPPAAGGIG